MKGCMYMCVLQSYHVKMTEHIGLIFAQRLSVFQDKTKAYCFKVVFFIMTSLPNLPNGFIFLIHYVR